MDPRASHSSEPMSQGDQGPLTRPALLAQLSQAPPPVRGPIRAAFAFFLVFWSKRRRNAHLTATQRHRGLVQTTARGGPGDSRVRPRPIQGRPGESPQRITRRGTGANDSRTHGPGTWSKRQPSARRPKRPGPSQARHPEANDGQELGELRPGSQDEQAQHRGRAHAGRRLHRPCQRPVGR